VTIGPDLSFDFGPLRTDRIWFLQYVGMDLAGDLIEIVLEPGERRAQDLKLAPGITLAGRVVDPSGNGVAGVQVTARVAGDVRAHARNHSVWSVADGAFRVGGVLAGEVELTAFDPAGRRGRLPLGPMTVGALRDGLVLVVRPE